MHFMLFCKTQILSYLAKYYLSKVKTVYNQTESFLWVDFFCIN